MAGDADDILTVEVRERVGYVTLRRPDRLNAISIDLQRAVADGFDRLTADPEVWAVLLTSAGTRAFSVGADLKEVGGADKSERPMTVPMTGVHRNFFEVVLECSKPTVAAIFGWTLGAGCELALACDVRVAADDLRMGLPEAKRGMGANFGSQVLPRVVPIGIAYQMLYTGEPIGAEDALRWGLVNEVVPASSLLRRAEAMVRSIVANSPVTNQRYKAMVTKGRDVPLAAALRLNVGPNPYLSEDRKEGVAAFLEKRTPQWQNR